jgi:hypothetical protein
MSIFTTKRYFGLFFLLAALVPISAKAQFGIYAMGSLGHLGSVNTGGTSSGGLTGGGATIGVYDSFLRLGPLDFGGDARYETQSSGDGHINQGLAGLRLALHAPILQPYVQAEVGGGSTNYSNDSGSFASQFQLGGDYTLIPHIALRGEYGVGRLSAAFAGEHQLVQQFGLGVVVRLF